MIAGAWYPPDRADLAEAVKGFMLNAAPPPVSGRVEALVCPHSGYGFSGAVAAAGYQAIRGKKYDRIIILCPSHGAMVQGIAVSSFTHYRTPLGLVEVDRKAQDYLSQSPIFKSDIQAEIQEYGVEAQLPFLQRVQNRFKIVPLLVGNLTTEQREEAAAWIRPLMGKGTLLLISSDFTHYGQQYGFVPFDKDIPNAIRRLDNGAIERLLAIDPGGFRNYCNRTQINICAREALALALNLIPFGYESAPLSYDNSSRLTNQLSNCISFAAIVYARPDDWIPDEEQQALYDEARLTAQAGLFAKGAKEALPPKPVLKSSARMRELERPHGAFVSVYRGDEMTAVKGEPVSKEPLRMLVHRLAWEAGLAAGKKTKNGSGTAQNYVEISVITQPMRAESALDLIPGRHGALLVMADKTAALLPQAARDMSNDRNRFLEALCERAGLSPDAWRTGQLYLFTAQVFGGEF